MQWEEEITEERRGEGKRGGEEGRGRGRRSVEGIFEEGAQKRGEGGDRKSKEGRGYEGMMECRGDSPYAAHRVQTGRGAPPRWQFCR